MGLTSSLYAGLSGMKTNEFRMDIVGNNIANVNTYGFKSSQATFQTLFSNTFSYGSVPSGAMGGSNPLQVGTGVGVGGVTRNFTDGSTEATGMMSNLSIQGQGLFVVKCADGSQAYTRDGSFQFNADNELITSDGNYLQGYTVDSNFNIIEGTLSNITIPRGLLTMSATTGNVSFSGNLNANGASAINGAGVANGNIQTILDTYNAGMALTDAGGALLGTTLLTNLQKDGTNILADGNTITMSNAKKGDQTLPAETFTVTATSTVQNLMDWMTDVLGINTTTPTIGGATAAGVTISTTVDAGPPATTTYGLNIVGNEGTENTIVMGSNALTIGQGAAAAAPPQSQPFSFPVADGFIQAPIESTQASFVAYDSLGTPINVNLTMVMESKDANGVTWRYFAECADDTDPDRVVGSGTISFDTNGNYLSGASMSISIDRDNTGAATPQAITLDFSRLQCKSLEGQSTSSVTMFTQDGLKTGTLTDYSVGKDGTITGRFDNGLSRTLGQVVLGTFRNYEGLVALSDNLYASGPNSGDCIVKDPSSLGAGIINAASLELSNVDLSREFINLIVSSTGFSASSRVIQTSNQLLTELMTMTR
jgi:flagellar hook protein FlgE